MDLQQREFMAHLRQTYRHEAAEHVAAIANGLVALEAEAPEKRQALVEPVFREIHGLKGAARSVELPEVEAVCQSMEGLCASARRGEVQLETAHLDRLHQGLNLVAGLSERAGSPLAESDQKQVRAILASFKAPAQPAQPAPAPPPPPVDPDTVRLEAGKLSGLLRALEELTPRQLTIGQEAAELDRLSRELVRWRQKNLAWLPQASGLELRALEKALLEVSRNLRADAHELALESHAVVHTLKSALMLPAASLLPAHAKAARDLARQLGKEIEVRVEAEPVSVDRRVLERLNEVVTHLVRNAVDHGLEHPGARLAAGKPGRGVLSLGLRAVDAGHVELQVADDGAGIDRDRAWKAGARLGLWKPDAPPSQAALLAGLFQSGLTTSPMATDLSGRGLGLSIVREKAERLGGRVDLVSEPGRGTTVRVVVPVTLQSFRAVLVSEAGQRFLVPSLNVERVVRMSGLVLGSVENQPTVTLDGEPLPLARLAAVLALAPSPPGQAALGLVVASANGRALLEVDQVLGELEIGLKTLGYDLRLPHVAGVALSHDRKVLPVLEPASLIERARSLPPLEAEPEELPELHHRVLVVEDSITSRSLLQSILEGAGFEVSTAVDGLDGWSQLQSGDFAAVVTDVDMPSLNGFELTARIRASERLAELPVVLVTALASPEDRAHGLRVGANAYLAKSGFDQNNLVECLRRWVGP